eukprot:EG_transcript_45109
MQHCSNASECAGIYWQRSNTRNQPIPNTQLLHAPAVSKLRPEEERRLVSRLHTESVRRSTERQEKLRDKWRRQLQVAKECRWPAGPLRRAAPGPAELPAEA